MYSPRRIAAGILWRSRRLLTRDPALHPGLHPRPQHDFWAVYARILDGETMWVAVAGEIQETSRLALLNIDSGAVTPIHTDIEVHGEKRLLVSRFPLLASADPLPLQDGDIFDLVVLDSNDGGHDAPRPVGLEPPAANRGPTRTPTSRDHDWRFRLQSGSRLQARLTCIALEPIAIVQSISVSADSVHLSFTVPNVRNEVDGLRLASEGIEHAWVAVTKEDSCYRADVAVGNLQVPHGVTARLLATGADGDLTLYRHHNDLKDPRMAVPMPTLRMPGRSDSIRLLFRPDGSLAARRTGGVGQQ